MLFIFLITLASGFILGSSLKKGITEYIPSRNFTKSAKRVANFDGKLVFFKEPEAAKPKPKIFRSTYVQRRYVVDEARWVQPRYISQTAIDEQANPAASSRDRVKRLNY